MRIFITLALALSLATCATAPAFSAPLAGLFAGGLTGLGGALVSGLLQTGLGLAVSWVAGKLFGNKPTDAEGPINPGEVQYGERVSRNGVFGIHRIAGHKVHYNEYSDAKQAQIVYVLADAWCDGLEAIYINGRQHALTSETPTGTEHKRYSISDFAALIDVRFHDGRAGQAADTELVAQTAGWDVNKTFSGQCYVAITVTSDKDKFNGLPEFEFVLKGQRVYDQRLDSTAGGAGAHRIADPTTWEWSANPFVCADHFLRGFYFNSERMLGAGLSTADIDSTTVLAAMNVADQVVTRPDSATRARYEAHLVYYDTDAPADVLSRLMAVSGGFYAEKAGQIALYAGAAQTSVITITDDDLVMDAPVKFSPKRAGARLFTGIQGTYTRSDDNLSAPYSGIDSSALVTEDNGRARTEAYDLPDVRDPHQAYLLAKQRLFFNRQQATAEIVLDLKDVLIEVGDWFDWNSANSLRGNRTWLVVSSQLDLSAARFRLGLKEISTTVFDDDATTDDIAEPSRTPGVFGYLSATANLAAAPISLTSDAGAVLPALEITYDAIIDPAVAAVVLEYRVKSTTDSVKVRDPSPGDGVFRTSQGVTPGKLFEVRAKLDTIPGRTIDWTAWADAGGTTPEPAVVDVGVSSLSTEVNAMRAAAMRQIDEVEAQVQQLGSLVAQQDNSQDGLASSIKTVSAQYDDVSASGLFAMQAQAAPEGWDARITLAVRASVGDDFVLTSISLDAKSDGTSRIVLDADNTVVTGTIVSVDGLSFWNLNTGAFRIST